MHEFSLMASVMDIAAEELSRHGAHKLKLLRLRCGELDKVQPDAMRLAFDSMLSGTDSEGALLEIVEEPLMLACPLCGHDFHPQDKDGMFRPCPSCGESTAFRVVKGEGIFLDHLEAE